MPKIGINKKVIKIGNLFIVTVRKTSPKKRKAVKRKIKKAAKRKMKRGR